MSPQTVRRTAAGPVQAVILDWAGTAVDFGCMGPAAVFVDVFQKFRVAVSTAEARRFMGLMKKDHIRAMCSLPRIAAAWQAVHGRAPAEADVDALYAETEPMMIAAISRHADPIPGLIEFVEGLRRKGIALGSSTGYTRPMMEVLVPEAARQGYRPDAVVCSSDVPAGRPHPWMCYLNAVQLKVYPLEAMVKIGDTVSDIEEGLNAGMWTVGITKSGNEVGLTQDEIARLAPADLAGRLKAAEESLKAAGAHYIVEGIWEALAVIAAIEARIAVGERP
jgi:phosphonoacetaldehyde hydrolase